MLSILAIVGIASAIDLAVWGLTGKDVVEHVTGVDLIDKGMEVVGIDPGTDHFEESGGLIGMVTGDGSDSEIVTAINDLGSYIGDAFSSLEAFLTSIFTDIFSALDTINQNVLIVMGICAVILVVTLCVFLVTASTNRKVRRLRR